MHIVLSGALPDPEVASELAPHLEKQAPTLARWLERADAGISPSPAADTRCTPLEHWLLQARGFQPAQSGHISAGLGPLRLPVDDDEPVWLGELVHMAPSRDGAALLPAGTLDISPDEAQALYESAGELIGDSGLRISPQTSDTWRVFWPEHVELDCASPELVAGSSVNDWWPQEDAARPWRQLINSLQMAWFDHPVNLARQQAGRPSINSLWLYGGARRSQLSRALPPDLHIDTRLQAMLLSQSWSGWIDTLAAIEQDLLAPLAHTRPQLVLTGREHYAQVEPRTSWLGRLRRQDWRSWWCSRR